MCQCSLQKLEKQHLLKCSFLSYTSVAMSCRYKCIMNKFIMHISVLQGFLAFLCTIQIVSSRDVKLLCPPSPAQCQYDDSVFDEHFYYVEGSKFEIDYKERYLWFKCPDGVGLESKSMPRFNRAVRVQRVMLTRCAAPAAPYARVLAALNVTLLDKLIIRRPRGDFRSVHFIGLNVSALDVMAVEPVELETGALEPLVELTELRLERVTFADADLLRLPPALIRLNIALSNITEFVTPALRRLSSLKYLTLHETYLTVAPDLSAVPSLQFVSFIAPLNGLPSSNSTKNVTSLNSRSLEIRGDCRSLFRLEISEADGPLPTAWLSRCPALTELTLSNMRLGALPGDMLHAAPRLQRLAVSGCGLRDLPPDMLARARNLQALDLSNNKLETLPEELLVSVRALLELDLSGNRLSRSGARPALAARSLRVLALDGNPLGDLCARSYDSLYRDGVSEVREMQALQSLRLARTGATRLCADWRRDMRALRDLDLRHNNISRLEAGDLQWGRDVATTVQLQGNPLRSVTLSPDEYRRALEAPLPAHVTKFSMDATFECDCRLYWAAQLVRRRPYVPIHDAECADGRKLLTASPNDLVCELLRDECVPHCSCRLHGTALHMDCAGAGLVRPVRPPPGTPPATVLLLANNSISTLDPADFGPELRLVDLSGNSIEDMDVETAAALLAPTRTIRLARNHLACKCGATLPAVLHVHSAQILDFGELRCADGRRLADLRPDDFCLVQAWRAALGAAGGALLLAAVALAVCLVRRPARRRIKRFLFDRGLCLRWLLREKDEADDRPYEYDVFVSFSHRDEKFVTERLVPELEAGPRPYRLCLHYRDWTPGEWIPTQISRSVRESRRTLLVVSSHWARSTWARAEFRAAYAQAQADTSPRLVLLLLEEPAALRDLDPDMQNFLAANTYLRWDDPWFWQKLRHALPRGKATKLPADVAPLESIAPSPHPAGDTNVSAPAGSAALEDAPLHTAPVA